MAEINGLTGIARQSVIDRHANKWLRVAGTVYDVFDKNQLVIVCLDGSDIGPNYWLEFDASDWRDSLKTLNVGDQIRATGKIKSFNSLYIVLAQCEKEQGLHNLSAIQ